jgi:predicted DNA-binding protein (MmcQ/YjbR family)
VLVGVGVRWPTVIDRATARAACLALPGASEDFPFGEETAVIRVGGRMFAILPVGGESISLKCDPALAEALREQHAAVRPGYHLAKRHWNTIELDGSLDDDELLGLVEHSYELVVARLPRAEREALERR